MIDTETTIKVKQHRSKCDNCSKKMRIVNLQAEVSELQSTIDTLSKEKERLSQRCTELEMVIRQSQMSNMQLRMELEDIKKNKNA